MHLNVLWIFRSTEWRSKSKKVATMASVCPSDVSSLKKHTLRIQLCPKKGINPTILLWGWDWDHQTYSREGYGSLGINNYN